MFENRAARRKLEYQIEKVAGQDRTMEKTLKAASYFVFFVEFVAIGATKSRKMRQAGNLAHYENMKNCMGHTGVNFRTILKWIEIV